MIGPTEVADRFEEAVLTLRRMQVYGLRPRSDAAWWPSTVLDPNEAYGWHETELRVLPSAAAIDRADEVGRWVTEYVTVPDERSLLWAAAHRYSWRKIARLMGCDGKTAKARWLRLLRQISMWVNLQGGGK